MVGSAYGTGSYTMDTGVEYHIQTEPWRYRCPHCGHSGHAMRRRYKRLCTMDNFKEVDSDRGMNDSKPDPSDIADFYCGDCQTPVEEPIDKKQ
jgi:Zn finger protein HypA/HybF involved in hydrogenase expression